MNISKPGFHFQPLQDKEITHTDNAPLLFTSRPLDRKGRVTVFMKTRRTLRRRLGVHDIGQIEGVLQESDREVGHDEMKKALCKMTQWRYLFPPEVMEPPSGGNVDCQEFSSLVQQEIG